MYAGIIDEIGRRQYSGAITWLREYIQNAIDGGSKSIKISIHENDLEISDNGIGMDRDIITTQAFSIGNSFKNSDDIGELGIGMYAGAGICDIMKVHTKMKNKPIFNATINMKKYRVLLSKDPKITFDNMMRKIFQISEDNSIDELNHDESFTTIRFEDLSPETLKLIKNEDLKKFLEYTVDLPLSEKFKHKESIENFLGNNSKQIYVDLDLDGTTYKLSKFEPGNVDFVGTVWEQDIFDDSNHLIGKIWAAYNKSGSSMSNAKILLKRKGITVGDESYIESKFNAKYSPRFFGEIILLDDSIEINTERNWFVSSPMLTEFVNKTKILLNELYGIANFDSQEGVGITNLISQNKKLEREAELNEQNKNIGIAMDKRAKIVDNERKINKKIVTALEFNRKSENGQLDIEKPTNKVKLELVEKMLGDPDVKAYTQGKNHDSETTGDVPHRRSSWPKAVRSFLKDNIIDQDLANRIGNGDIKDITNRAFTFIEDKIKKMLGKKEQEKVEWNSLIKEFKNKYEPPELNGFSTDDYIEAFDRIMKGIYTILRNPSNHSFMDDRNNERNIFEVMLIADFIVNWINQWRKKGPR